MCGVTEVRDDIALLLLPTHQPQQEEKMKTMEESINCAVIFEPALGEAYTTEIETRHQINAAGYQPSFHHSLDVRLISVRAVALTRTC